MHGSDFETRAEKEVKVKLMPITKVRVISVFQFDGAELIGFNFFAHIPKVQEISKGNFGVFHFPKKQQKYFPTLCRSVKKGIE